MECVHFRHLMNFPCSVAGRASFLLYEAHPASMPPMKYWEIVADKLSPARLPIFIGKAAEIAAGRGAVAAQ